MVCRRVHLDHDLVHSLEFLQVDLPIIVNINEFEERDGIVVSRDGGRSRRVVHLA